MSRETHGKAKRSQLVRGFSAEINGVVAAIQVLGQMRGEAVKGTRDWDALNSTAVLLRIRERQIRKKYHEAKAEYDRYMVEDYCDELRKDHPSEVWMSRQCADEEDGEELADGRVG